MNFEEIKQLVTGIVAALGGAAGIIALIKAFASMFSAWKNGSTAQKIKSLIEQQSEKDIETIKQGLNDGLNCKFDIDITDKFKEMFGAQVAEMRKYVEDNRKQTAALKSLMCHIAEMYQRSKSLTADERAELGKAINAAKGTISEPIVAPKPTVQITYKPETLIEETAEPRKSVAEDTKFDIVL